MSLNRGNVPLPTQTDDIEGPEAALYTPGAGRPSGKGTASNPVQQRLSEADVDET